MEMPDYKNMSNEEIYDALEGYSDEEALLIKLKIWFDSRIDKLKQVSELKDDDTLIINNEAGDEIELKGDLKKGVRWGCGLAIDIFGEFPLTIDKD